MSKQNKKNSKQTTIGLDLGDRKHTYCALSGGGEVMKEATIHNERGELTELTRQYPGATVVMEAGTHSPWVSRYLQELGMRVIVANPRKTRAIYENVRKSDRKDAMMLARLGRMDPELLYPIEHGSRQAQEDMVQIKLRDSLVRSRVALICAVRFILKSQGYRVSNPSSDRFHKVVGAELPETIRAMIAHNVAAIGEITERIKALDKEISRLASERYPETEYLQQISGVGPITSLYFVLKVENPNRFESARDIGPYLGLCPKRDQSGETDKELHVSKCGDRYLRKLLVSAAQYIIGPFGCPSALREYGMRLAEDGTGRAKKRAVVAVARKLAVLLLTLWKGKVCYEPYPVMAI